MSRDVRAWVFAGGQFEDSHFPRDELLESDLIVCADRGVEHCLAMGLFPTLLVGDFDSASDVILQDARLADVPRHVFPTDKASSDLELALEILAQMSVNTVIVIGVSGGRTDHMLFNWILPSLTRWPFQLQLIDSTVRCYVLQGPSSWTAQVPAGRIVSLLSLKHSTGVCTDGLRFALHNATLTEGSTRGLSNEVLGPDTCVSIVDGTLLVLLQQENTELNSTQLIDEKRQLT